MKTSWTRFAVLTALLITSAVLCRISPAADEPVGFLRGDILLADPVAFYTGVGGSEFEDNGRGAIYYIDRQDGEYAVVSTGQSFVDPTSLAAEPTGMLVVVDQNWGEDQRATAGAGGAVLRVDPSAIETANATVLSSGGNFVDPVGITVDPATGTIYVCDRNGAGGGRIIAVDPGTGAQTMIASGNLLLDPQDIAWRNQDEHLYVADPTAGAVIRVNPSTGAQTTLASGGFLVDPVGIGMAPGGGIFVADEEAGASGLGQIIFINPAGGAQTVISSETNFEHPHDVGVEPGSTSLIVTDPVAGLGVGSVLRVAVADGAQTVLATGADDNTDFVEPLGVLVIPNRPPVVQDDRTVTVAEDSANTPLNIPAPTDADGDSMIITVNAVPGSTQGDVRLSGGGAVVTAGQVLTEAQLMGLEFDPALNANGASGTFTYQVSDGIDVSFQVLTLVITPVNDTPVAVNDSYTTDEDTTLNVPLPGVLDNDTDIDGDSLSAVMVLGPAHGNLTLNPDGSFSYTPAMNYFGPDSFTYHPDDGDVEGNTATVSITVTSVNDAPTAVDDMYSTAEDTTLNVNAAMGLLDNDTDPESDGLVVVLPTSLPTHGMVSVSSSGAFSYTPDADYVGPDSFTYRVSDGLAESNTATVNLNVTALNDLPVAVADGYATSEDTPLMVAAPGVLDNDTDAESSPLTAVLVTGPSHGGLVFNSDGSFTYTPTANYNGLDSFTYSANDGTGTGSPGTVSINVMAVNDPPEAFGDSYSTIEDMPLNVPSPGVLENDEDLDGDTLTAAVVTTTSHGTLNLVPGGGFTYTPETDYFGPDSFTYQASDAMVPSNVVTVNITVIEGNEAPVANPDSYATEEDTPLTVALPGVLDNDTDADADPLTATVVMGPAHGTLNLATDGSFTYTPAENYNGPDSFTYRANDGEEDSNTATVTLTVNAANDAPVADPDSHTTAEDTVLDVAAPGVLDGDTDVDGDALNAVLVSNTTHGALTLNPNGSFTYTPAENYFGPDSFTYRANDGAADSNVATVTLTVTAVNDAPVAMPDTYSTFRATTLTVPAPGVLGNDTDVESSPLTAALVASPSQGAFTLNSNGSFTYTPPVAFSGPIMFAYRASDGDLDSNIATVTINVSSDPPPSSASGRVTGSGKLIGSNPPQVFAITAAIRNGVATGKVDFVDRNLARRMVGGTVSTVIITGRRARIFGQGRLRGVGLTWFVIDVEDVARPGNYDTFAIELGNGQSVPSRRVQGAIQVRP